MNEQDQILTSFVDDVMTKQKRITASFIAVLVVSVVIGVLVLTYFTRQVKTKVDQAQSLENQLADAKGRLNELQSQIVVAQQQRDITEKELQDKKKELAEVVKAVEERNTLNAKANPTAAVVPVVYIQFSGGLDRGVAQGLRALFNRRGFPAPGVEMVDKEYGDEVRYFHPEDGKLAEEVASIARAFFQTKGCPVALPSKLVALKARPKRGQIEVWISSRCSG